MRLDHVNCIACKAHIPGPFVFPEGPFPPDICPHCGKETYVTSREEAEGALHALDLPSAILDMDPVTGEVFKIEGNVEEMGAKAEALIKKLQETAKGKRIDIVAEVKRNYEAAKRELPKGQAEMALLVACLEALWRAHSRAGLAASKNMLN